MPSAYAFGTTLLSKPSSAREQIIPSDTSPRSFARLILSPPGSLANFGYDYFLTSCNVWSSTNDLNWFCFVCWTRHLFNFSASGWRSHDNTSPTTTFFKLALNSSTPSISIPVLVIASPSSSAVNGKSWKILWPNYMILTLDFPRFCTLELLRKA